MNQQTLPAAVDVEALAALRAGQHARDLRPLGVREVAGHLVKVYAVVAPGRAVPEPESVVALAGDHLQLGPARGSLGLAVVIVHAGGDGDYVLVHTWIEGYMSDLAVFSGPPGEPGALRPGRVGLAPCVWEAAVLAHEREAFARHLLDEGASGAGAPGAEAPCGGAQLAARLDAWAADTLAGPVG